MNFETSLLTSKVGCCTPEEVAQAAAASDTVSCESHKMYEMSRGVSKLELLGFCRVTNNATGVAELAAVTLHSNHITYASDSTKFYKYTVMLLDGSKDLGYLTLKNGDAAISGFHNCTLDNEGGLVPYSGVEYILMRACSQKGHSQRRMVEKNLCTQKVDYDAIGYKEDDDHYVIQDAEAWKAHAKAHGLTQLADIQQSGGSGSGSGTAA